ncbi:glycerol-3-phosphate phosphatase-like [Homarus americanus]|uniref:glycerol-3-phosphate phosphatase-like n=1 Tax=Homarus americanus TaxID=6706 RepID=UPI001C48E62D|nr:glycerol-3-phosphate phosphatase-like [Homarus americanus]XP_042215565.1 glycerol-3-phosphate phosphatase-like [Homarus americanus]
MPGKFPQLVERSHVKEFLDSFDIVLTDCDGVLWCANAPIGKANEALNQLRALGKKIFYVTNNSSKSREEYAQKCKKLGFIADKEEIVCTAYVTALYLKQKNFNKKVYIVGASGITQELDNVGIAHTGIEPEPFSGDVFDLKDTLKLDPEVGAVTVGLDPYISFPKVMRAASYLSDPDCLFIATNTDEKFPLSSSNLVMPGAGAIVKCVETVAERSPVVMGKPSVKMFSSIRDQYQLDPSRTLMIGDRCNTDILFGKNCGLHTMVVLSGVTEMKDLEAWAASSDEEKHKLLADYYLPQLDDLIPLLE